MKLYFTIESYRKLRHLFSNLNTFYTIDVNALINESTLDLNKESDRFIINAEIEKMILSASKLKRYTGIIYINSAINENIITNIKDSINSFSKAQIEYYTLLDDYDFPKMKNCYHLFDEVIFFPTFKKTKIIECKNIIQN